MMIGPEAYYEIEIKGKTVDLAVREDTPRGLAAEGLEAALRIGQTKSAHDPKHLYVSL